MKQYRWYVYRIGATPAQRLGTFRAPDREAAIERAIEVLCIPEHERFRIDAALLGEAEERPPQQPARSERASNPFRTRLRVVAR